MKIHVTIPKNVEIRETRAATSKVTQKMEEDAAVANVLRAVNHAYYGGLLA